MMKDGMKEQFENEKELKESSEIKQIYDFFEISIAKKYNIYMCQFM